MLEANTYRHVSYVFSFITAFIDLICVERKYDECYQYMVHRDFELGPRKTRKVIVDR